MRTNSIWRFGLQVSHSLPPCSGVRSGSVLRLWTNSRHESNARSISLAGAWLEEVTRTAALTRWVLFGDSERTLARRARQHRGLDNRTLKTLSR